MKQAIGNINSMTRLIKNGVFLILIALWGSMALANDGDTGYSEEQANQDHEALYQYNQYPSANTCQPCHPGQYREWSVSQHAYAQMSPVFNTFQAAVSGLTDGTNADFCIRCHTPVGMTLKEPIFLENHKRHPTSREGVTCIVCHRLNENYGKVSGRLFFKEGDLFEPVYGPSGSDELNRVIESGTYGVNPVRGKAGRTIHKKAEKFFKIKTSGLCGLCHDVNLLNGFRLEEAFSEFKTSPAARNGVNCNDCHMGKVHGKVSGYRMEPAAIVGGKPTMVRKRTNHMFPGPDYSLIHAGIFPHNNEASDLADIPQWLTFDYKAGWGTDEFEDAVSEDFDFPERWKSRDDRYDAMDIIQDNLALLQEAQAARLEVLRNGYQIGEIKTIKASEKGGLKFSVEVKNATDGHGIPTGFDSERVAFLQVTVTDSEGTAIFKSGDLDPNGDVRDNHSLYVHNGELPLDRQLFSLQSRFITRMIRGGDREQILPINYSQNPLVFLRPQTSATNLVGRPTNVRKHKKNIEPLGRRIAKYRVKPSLLTGKGPYNVNVKFWNGMVPVNLIAEIKIVGFDYHMSPREIADGIVAGHSLMWERNHTIHVE